MGWFNFFTPSEQVDDASSEFAHDEPTDAQLETANQYLRVLAEVFHGDDVDFIRELVLQNTILTDDMSPESILENTANVLTTNKGPLSEPLRRSKTLEQWQILRSEGYKRAVRRLIDIEFRLLSANTRNNVLLENNFDYYRTKTCLTEKASQSYRVAFLSLFSGTPPPLPLPSGNEELDAELTREEREEQVVSDNQYARELNEQIYEAEESLFVCQCCYGDFAWEDIAFCPDEHFFCRPCLKTSVERFFQGVSSGIVDMEKASVRCISVEPINGCDQCISAVHLEHFLPPGLYQQLVDKIESRNLNILASQTTLLRCPFCSYAVVDQKFVFQLDTTNLIKDTYKIMFILLITSRFVPVLRSRTTLIILAVLLFLSVAFWTILPYIFASFSHLIVSPSLQSHLDEQARKCRRPKWLRMLSCQNRICEKQSCLDCREEWIGFHSCLKRFDSKLEVVQVVEKEKPREKRRFDSEEAFVERKVDEAIKRVCPQCNTSFVKESGCNKVSCPCGYKMCYICRADIREMGYQHFCTHFNPNPGRKCDECDKCLIHQDLNEEEIIAQVKEKAREEWKRKNKKQTVDEDEEARNAHGMKADEIGLAGFDAWLFELIMWVNGPEK
ncbi:hypothetical protein DL96DRAFT_717888 [Flagelloscypha sp. PMI_526]|nr:hypothetical protein DL96DRAFT_717888 [Flagelloscypha sp. PMI_526]